MESYFEINSRLLAEYRTECLLHGTKSKEAEGRRSSLDPKYCGYYNLTTAERTLLDEAQSKWDIFEDTLLVATFGLHRYIVSPGDKDAATVEKFGADMKAAADALMGLLVPLPGA